MFTSPLRSALLCLAAGCATAPSSARAPTRPQDLALASLAGGELVRAASGAPVSVRVEDARGAAEALAARLVDALGRADEDALRESLAAEVEGIPNGPQAGAVDLVEGREQVLSLLRPWLQVLSRSVTPGAPRGVNAQLLAHDACTPSTCGPVFLRRGDWYLSLSTASFAGLPRRRSFRGAPTLPGAPTTSPPRFFVLREVEGRMRVVAVNDDLLRAP